MLSYQQCCEVECENYLHYPELQEEEQDMNVFLKNHIYNFLQPHEYLFIQGKGTSRLPCPTPQQLVEFLEGAKTQHFEGA